MKGPERRAAIEEHTLPDEASGPYGIAAGPDGALWFTEMRSDRIGRMTTGGEVSAYSLQTVDAGPAIIAAGPDSALWFSQFDRGFMPAKTGLESRWKRIDRAFHRGEELPPVVLYKLLNSYFVLDGNHRVSIARYHGVEMIEAEVAEFGARPPIRGRRRLLRNSHRV